MKSFKLMSTVLSMCVAVLALGYELAASSRSRSADRIDDSSAYRETSRDHGSRFAASAGSSYRLDAAQSKFIAHALAGGLFWFKGHEHLVAVREFSGEARLDPDALANSSLELDAKTASMEETSSVFTDAQKKIINKELHDIVLLPDQYSDIVFRSTRVTGKTIDDLKIAGDLTLNGVTRPITIPAKVTVTGNDLRAQGEFSIHRSEFKVKATSAFHGLVRVRDKLKFSFDIVGHRSSA
jgi:polyisoprenoid-binding protein YceI